MKQIKNIIPLLVVFFTVVFLFKPQSAYADNSCTDVRIYAIDNSGNVIDAPDHFTDETFDTIRYTITVNDPNAQYEVIGDDGINVDNPTYGVLRNYYEIKNGPILQGSINKSANSFEFKQSYNNHRLTVKRLYIDPTTKQQSWQVVCNPDSDSRLHYFIDPAPTPTPYYSCNLFGKSNNSNQNMITELDNMWILGNISPNPVDTLSVNMKLIDLGNNSSINLYPKMISRTDPKNTYQQDFEVNVGQKRAGTYRVLATPVQQVCDSSAGTMACYDQTMGISCSLTFSVCTVDSPNCGFPTPTPTLTPTPTPPARCFDASGRVARDNGICTGYEGCPWCRPTPTKRPAFNIPNLKPLCDQLTTENSYRDKCWTCQKDGKIWSAIGCLPTDFSTLIKDYIFKYGIGIAGGIAFLYFLYGAFMILTSSGNAEKMEEAKQIITSSLAGLLLIIFSIFLLKTIGFDILQLPGFK